MKKSSGAAGIDFPRSTGVLARVETRRNRGEVNHGVEAQLRDGPNGFRVAKIESYPSHCVPFPHPKSRVRSRLAGAECTDNVHTLVE
jgi:hypothetical protein